MNVHESKVFLSYLTLCIENLWSRSSSTSHPVRGKDPCQFTPCYDLPPSPPAKMTLDI